MEAIAHCRNLESFEDLEAQWAPRDVFQDSFLYKSSYKNNFFGLLSNKE